MPRRAKDRRLSIEQMKAQVEKSAAGVGCTKLIHIALPSTTPPLVMPGCAACADMLARWEKLPPLVAPTLPPQDTDNEEGSLQ
jgi:hypothetical protein